MCSLHTFVSCSAVVLRCWQFVCHKGKMDFFAGCSRSLFLLAWGVHLRASWSVRMSGCKSTRYMFTKAAVKCWEPINCLQVSVLCQDGLHHSQLSQVWLGIVPTSDTPTVFQAWFPKSPWECRKKCLKNFQLYVQHNCITKPGGRSLFVSSAELMPLSFPAILKIKQ